MATSPVGEYDITVEGGAAQNYSFKYVPAKLTVNKAPLKVKADDKSRMEGEANPELTVTYTGFKNGETASVLDQQPTVTTTATKESPVGTYPITVSGGSAKNYELSYENGTLTITEGKLQLTAKSYTREYGEDNPVFEFEQAGTATLKGVPAITCAATKESPVGTYDIIIEQGTVENGNVTFVNGKLTITPAQLTVAAEDATRMKGEANPEFTLSYSGWKNGETEEVLLEKPVATTVANEQSEAGEYEITVTGGKAQNYTFTYVNGKLTVTPWKVVIDVDDNENNNIEEIELCEDGTAKFIGVNPQQGIGSIDKVEIPETVDYDGMSFTLTEIAENAFKDQSSIATVIIPKSIQMIGTNAFAGCVSLTSLFVDIEEPIILQGASARGMGKATDTADDDPVFSGVNKHACVLYVPIGSKEKYEAAPVWNTFEQIKEIDIQGIAEIANDAEGISSVYSISGTKVRSNASSMKGLSTGIYIVNGKKVMVK